MDPQILDEGVAFDMSFSTNSRINYLLWKSNEAQQNYDVDSWYIFIKIIYKEADCLMNKKERTMHERLLGETEKAYTEYNQAKKKYLQTQHKSSNIIFSPPRQIFDKLFNLELSLRRFLDKKKLLFKKGEKSGKSILG